ncbi:hypothetical protein DW322_17885 [Rhodococcus rhodnii]|uniref:Uncharacterized protein n=1 Tax=Rhodococcus rhodnii TaxID=38312 RepID=A0A6P2CG32_9NOCA|nr:hypothetical protein DW322_17885 [Rhodococcus rhodnii]
MTGGGRTGFGAPRSPRRSSGILPAVPGTRIHESGAAAGGFGGICAPAPKPLVGARRSGNVGSAVPVARVVSSGR